MCAPMADRNRLPPSWSLTRWTNVITIKDNKRKWSLEDNH